MAEIGRRVDVWRLGALPVPAEAHEAKVMGQNVFMNYETADVELTALGRVAMAYPSVRIVHMYEAVEARTRGIAIYEGGRLESLRHVEGEAFREGDWLSFPLLEC